MNKKLTILRMIDCLDVSSKEEKEIYFKTIDTFSNILFESDFDNDIRQNGKTTRQVDKYIQDLFTDGIILIKDHFSKSLDNSCNSFYHNGTMYSLIQQRLELEHSRSSVTYDKKKLIIKLN